MTTPDHNTQPATRLMARYQHLKETIAQYKTEMDNIKTQLAHTFPQGGEIDGHKISITRGRVSWPKAAKAFPMTDFPQLYRQEIVIDQEKAQAQIAPATLDQYRTESTVSIR